MSRRTTSLFDNLYLLSDIGPNPPLVPAETRQTSPDPWSDIRPHEIKPDQTTLLDRDLWPIPQQSLSQRIMDRLWQLHCREPRQELADDYRIAWITVYLAWMHPGLPRDVDPWKSAFYQYIGDAPEKLIPFFMARAYADRHFPAKYLPFKYTKGWQKDFEYHCGLIGIPVENLVPVFLSQRKELGPRKSAQPLSERKAA